METKQKMIKLLYRWLNLLKMLGRTFYMQSFYPILSRICIQNFLLTAGGESSSKWELLINVLQSFCFRILPSKNNNHRLLSFRIDKIFEYDARKNID